MQSSSITLILVLCLMGGVIAYLADLLGRRLGKKRLTLGHMRPKHTAALLTTSAGVLIPLVTIGLMSLLFSDVREMLFRTEAIKEELRRVEGNMRVSEKQLQQRSTEIAELELQQRRLQNEGNRLKDTNDKTQKQLGTTKRELGGAQRQLASRTVELRIITAKTRSLNERVNTLLREVKQNTAQLKVVKADAIAAQGQAKTNRDLANKAADELRDIQTRNIEIERKNVSLEAQTDELSKELEELRKTSDEVSAGFTAQVEAAKADLAKLKQDQEQLVAGLQALLVEQSGVARTQRLIYSFGEELARWIIEPNSSREEASLGLSSLLRTARVRAESRGAKASRDAVSAGLLSTETSPATFQTDTILRSTTSQSEPMVLQAVSIFNHFNGEPVFVEVRVAPNTVVYRAGQVIAETRIDGALDERRILEAIGAFIRDRVGPKALEDKMIPAFGSDAPLGEVDDEQIVSLMQLIRDYGRSVRVQAVAAGEIRRADRLRLEFRLR